MASHYLGRLASLPRLITAKGKQTDASYGIAPRLLPLRNGAAWPSQSKLRDKIEVEISCVSLLRGKPRYYRSNELVRRTEQGEDGGGQYGNRQATARDQGEAGKRKTDPGP